MFELEIIFLRASVQVIVTHFGINICKVAFYSKFERNIKQGIELRVDSPRGNLFAGL